MASTETLVRKNRVLLRKFKGYYFCDFSGTVNLPLPYPLWKEGFTMAEWEREAEEFQAQEDDIWVSSFPKSGESLL